MKYECNFRFITFLILQFTSLFLNGCSGCSYFYLNISSLDNSTLVDNGNTQTPTPTELPEISFSDIKSNSLIVNWSGASSEVLKYTIAYGTSTGEYSSTLEIDSSLSSFKVENLTYSTQYFFIIKAEYSNNIILTSQERFVTTNSFTCADHLTSSILNIKGMGTISDPYIICSPFQFKTLAKIESVSYLDKSFELGRDIDFSQLVEPYDPIGSLTFPFMGQLNGQNFTLSNLNIVTLGTVSNVGLFGVTKKAQFQKLKLNNFNFQINSSASNVAALIGQSLNNTFIENIELKNINLNVLNGDNIGGVLGYGDANVIHLNTDEVSSLQGKSNVGGVIGYWINKSESGNVVYILQNNINDAIVSLSLNGTESVGGLVGVSSAEHLTGSYQNVILKSNFGGMITTTATTASINIGGLVGFNDTIINILRTKYNGIINNCGSFCGGIIGKSFSIMIMNIESCLSEGIIYGNFDVGGIYGYLLNGNVRYTKSSSMIYGNNAVGGFGGYSNQVTFNHVVFSGTIDKYTDSEVDHVGGFFGEATSNSTLYNGISYGKILSAGSISGGILGNNNSASGIPTVSKSFWDKDISGLTQFCGGTNGSNCNTAGMLNLGRSNAELQSPSTIATLTSNDSNWTFFGVADDANPFAPIDDWVISVKSGMPDLLLFGFDPLIHHPFGVGMGSGTISDPFLIDHSDDLNLISKNYFLKGDHYYKLISDIDFTQLSSSFVKWDFFNGVFDGNNYFFKKLVINSTGVSNLGLIGASSGSLIQDSVYSFKSLSDEIFFIGQFKNLNISQFSLTGNNTVAALNANDFQMLSLDNVNVTSSTFVGQNFVSSLGRNCFSVKNSIANVVVSGHNTIGGVCSFVIFFENVISSGSIQGYNNVGGVFGSNSSQFGTEIDFSNFKNSIGAHFSGNVVSTGTNAGGIFGSAGMMSVSQLKLNNSSRINGNENVGGLVGEMTYGSISNSSVRGAMSTPFQIVGQKNVGGAIGQISDINPILFLFYGWSGNLKFQSVDQVAINHGTITAQNQVGGLIGVTSGSLTSKVISNSYSQAQITTSGGSDSVGGLIGLITSAGTIGETVTLSNLYYAGIISSSASNVGGLIGVNSSSNTIFNYNFWDSTKNASLSFLSVGNGGVFSSAEIEPKSTSELTTNQPYLNGGWDLNSIWTSSGTLNQGYPELSF